ncbi:M48 family metallopeptidase [Sandarakinorhabdus sp. DWP1-3-1]|uniref:M48 family metallopeptidase n=1 Tax=Sandarakinorhabdus sp. DWP1-3-1 TaxID=2804627 RepID=UPI003CEF6D4D
MVAERRPGARGIRLRADSIDGAVRFTLPPRGGIADAATLLDRHQDWLARQVAGWPVPLPFAPGAIIPFDGSTLMLDWAAAHPRLPQRNGDVLRIGGPIDALPARVLRWLKAAALADMEPLTRALAARVDRNVSQVRVGDTRSRWGSCVGNGAGAGRIAYSWRLILAPSLVRRNVVAHEVAHLVHANHGPGFHALLAELDANGAASKRWLRAHGAGLHWVGRAA